MNWCHQSSIDHLQCPVSHHWICHVRASVRQHEKHGTRGKTHRVRKKLIIGSSHWPPLWSACHQGVAPELARLWKAKPRMPATVPVVRSTVIRSTRPKTWFCTVKPPMETASLPRVPATWPEPYVTANCLVDDLKVEEEAVLSELPVVQTPVLDPLPLPPSEGF